MLYIAKLARRLALSRPTLTLLLLLPVLVASACSGGEPTAASGSGGAGGNGPIVISPRLVTVEPDQQVRFAAYDSALAGSEQVTGIEWTATGGSISLDGTFSSAQTGDFLVKGRRRGNPHTDTSTVIVVPRQPTVTAVTATPTNGSVDVNGQLQFQAVGTLSDGSTVAIGVEWRATGGAIDAGGLYTAGGVAGNYRVIAKHTTTGLADTVPVSVSAAAPTLKAVVVTPASVSLQTGASQQFSAAGLLSDGTTTPVSVTYTGTGGTVSAGGLYTAGSVTGTYRVIAKQAGGTLADTSVVTITAPAAPPATGTGVQAAPSDSFVNSIGVAMHITYSNTPYGTAWPTVKARLLELGVRHIRDGGWNSDYYAKVNDLAANGIKVLQVTDPRQVTAQQAYQLTKANLLNAVEAVEGPNEYDASGDANWTTTLTNYLRDRYNYFRSDPATAGISLVGTAFIGWTATTQIGDVSAWVDRSNEHPLRYFPPDTPTNQTNQNIEKETYYRGTPYGHKPMWASETGYPTCATGDGISELAQAKYMPRTYLRWWQAGVERTYVYEFLDEHATVDPSCETRYGILRNDLSPKPAFTAIKNLIAVLADPGAGFAAGRLAFTLTGDLTNVRTGLFQKRNGTFYLVLVQAVSVYNVYGTKADITNAPRNLTLTFPAAVSQVRVFTPRLSANPGASYTSATSVGLAVPDELMVVEITP